MKTFFIALWLPVLMAMTTSAVDPGIGDLVPDFELKNLDGSFFSMDDRPDAKGFIVVFTCNTCPVAKLYEERIKELDAQFSERGWPLVAINSNDPLRKPGDSYEAMQSYAQQRGFNFPYLYDADQSVARAFGATRTPEVYLVWRNEEGELRLAYTGAIDDNSGSAEAVTVKYVEQAIHQLEAGLPIEPEKTRAIGCTIKWKE